MNINAEIKHAIHVAFFFCWLVLFEVICGTMPFSQTQSRHISTALLIDRFISKCFVKLYVRVEVQSKRTLALNVECFNFAKPLCIGLQSSVNNQENIEIF